VTSRMGFPDAKTDELKVRVCTFLRALSQHFKFAEDYSDGQDYD